MESSSNNEKGKSQSAAGERAGLAGTSNIEARSRTVIAKRFKIQGAAAAAAARRQTGATDSSTKELKASTVSNETVNSHQSNKDAVKCSSTCDDALLERCDSRRWIEP